MPPGERHNGDYPAKLDAIAVCADSDLCCRLVNDYSLRESIPVVYGAIRGVAETAEIIVVAGETHFEGLCRSF